MLHDILNTLRTSISGLEDMSLNSSGLGQARNVEQDRELALRKVSEVVLVYVLT